MGRALLEASYGEVAALIRSWCCEAGFTPDQHFDRIVCTAHSSRVVHLTARSAACRASWRYKPSTNALLLDFAVRPRLYYSFAMFVPFLFGILYCILLLSPILNTFEGRDVVTFMMCALLSMLCDWWRTHKVEPRLGQMEHSFWSTIERSCDCRHLNYCSGSTYSPSLNLTVELVLAVCLILLCGKLTGIVGAGIAFLTCVLVISRYVVGILQDRDPYNQWHLCLMDNATSWTLLTLTMTGAFIIPFAMEVLLPQRLYLAETPPSIQQAFAHPHFRDITPPTAGALESDCIQYVSWLAEDAFSRSDHLSDTIDPTLSAKIQGQMVIYGWIFLVILWIPIYFFSVRPLLRNPEQAARVGH